MGLRENHNFRNTLLELQLHSWATFDPFSWKTMVTNKSSLLLVLDNKNKSKPNDNDQKLKLKWLE